MKQHLLTLFLALAASVGTLFAQSGTCGDNLTWTLDTESGTLTISGTGAMKDYTYSGGKSNTPWDSYRESIKTVKIGSSVTSIGEWAFYHCNSLTSVTIPNSVTSIGERAFYECSSLTSVTIPNSVTSIGNSAFNGCSSLTSVTIPNSVASIGDYAFSSCSSLTSITVPNSVINFGREPFMGCYSLPVIDNIRYADTYLVAAVDKTLSTYTIKEGTRWIGDDAFQYCSKLTSIDIPNSVTTIGESAFKSCISLTSITIPNSVTSIGQSAFSSCSSLTSVTIPNSVTSIGNSAFNGCYSLTSITIPNSVTSIGNKAFYGCSGLTSITIPNSVTSIGSDAFYKCSSLTAVHISDIAAWCKIAFSDYKANPLSYAHNLYLNGTLVTDLVIPDGVTSIKNYAFSGCSGLTSVVWNAKNCQDFTSAPFDNQITSFTFGPEVEHIPAYLCGNLSNVNNIVLPCSVKSIGENAFHFSTVISRDCGIRTSDTYLTLCEGENVKWNNTNIVRVKPSDNGDYTYETKTVLYDDSIATLHLSVNPAYKTVLPDTILCYSDDLILGGAKCPLTKTANTKQTWTRNLKSAEGCDSTVTINVTWRKLPDFTITAKHEYDTYNSGSISYHANYSGKYYYTLNGEKGRSLSNLPAGTYRLVFFSEECDDSVEKTVQIYQYGMKVNNQYYLLDTENHTATLTYRGASYSDYSNEYSGNITIPESITFNGQEYKVTGIGASAFSGCSVTSVTMTSKQPVTISNSCGLGSAIVYVPFGSLSDYKKTSYWKNYNLHVINPSHSSSSSSATSATITLGNNEEAKHIASCGMEGGEEFAGNVIEYIGLEPNSEYTDVPFFVKTKEGDYDNIKATFKTTALTLTTLASKAVSNTTSILLAETNMSDSETSCGFEWRRNDQPADMPATQVLCPIANGLMAGRLKGLKDDVYYKYRAFYKSAAGKMYYGDWQYVFTGDVTVEFDPVLYTYAAQFVSERKATLKGYALAGSDDFTEQGFEYWAESRRTDVPARRAPQYAIGEKHTITGTGISMRVTLEDLDEGTVYKYRTYAKVGGKTLYGSEMTFTTQGIYEDPIETDLDLIPDADADEDSLTPTPRTPQARKYLRNGILYIEHNGITYTAQGHRLD